MTLEQVIRNIYIDKIYTDKLSDKESITLAIHSYILAECEKLKQECYNTPKICGQCLPCNINEVLDNLMKALGIDKK